tara:strand:- start:7024 stop:7452 length:429 start_codon:yes stop_codon:yes gene_type:complete
MAMEPVNLDDNVYHAPYEVQLMNLGRIIENPSLIMDFKASDFMDKQIYDLIKVLKSDKTKEAKNLHLKMFMRSRGLANWGGESSGCRKELFDTQRRQVAISTLALHASMAVERLQALGTIGNTERLLEALENIKGFVKDASI